MKVQVGKLYSVMGKTNVHLQKFYKYLFFVIYDVFPSFYRNLCIYLKKIDEVILFALHFTSGEVF